MYSFRIGNDLHIRWRVKRNGVPEDFGGRSVTVRLLDAFGRMVRINYTIEENLIDILYSGKNQKSIGCYNLVLVLNEDKENMSTLDRRSAFRLVAHNCCDCPNHEIDIESDFCMPANGLSAYELACVHGFKGTEEQWLEQLLSFPDAPQDGEYYVRKDGKWVIIPAGGGSNGEKLTKEAIERELTGDITTHNHNTQIAEALASALANYVQKVVGKDLSTNDFTNALKQKLEGLSNYDDAAVQQAITTINNRIDTLVGTSASTAIDTFNEIEAFLAGITDEKTLTGMLADLKREIVALIPSTEGLATKEEVTAVEGKIPTRTSQLNNDSNFLTEHQSLLEYAKKTEIPKNTSELNNDSNFVSDADYHHTDNNYTTKEKKKLASLSNGVSSYNDLTEKPQIGGVELSGNKTPEQLGLQKKGDYALKSEIPSLVDYAKKSDVTTAVSDKATKQELKEVENKIPSTTNLATKDELKEKQNTLVSGENIATINNQDITKGGNITIEGGVSNEIEVTETKEAPTDPSVELWAELTDDPSEIIESTPMVNHGVGDLEFAITPNVYHVWGEVATLKITQTLVEDGDLDIYMFEFISGASATSLTYPVEWKWLNGTPTINPNKRYQIGVSRNLAKIDEYEK